MQRVTPTAHIENCARYEHCRTQLFNVDVMTDYAAGKIHSLKVDIRKRDYEYTFSESRSIIVAFRFNRHIYNSQPCV